MSTQYHIGMEINVLSNLIHREIDSYVSKKSPNFIDENITAINGHVIGFLYMNSDKDIFQRDIEELLQIRRSTASTLLQGMEAKGLIQREPVAFDARLKKLVLTEKSIAAHKQIATNISSFENKLTKDILEEELKTFFQVINKIKNNLTK